MNNCFMLCDAAASAAPEAPAPASVCGLSPRGTAEACPETVGRRREEEKMAGRWREGGEKKGRRRKGRRWLLESRRHMGYC